MNTALALRQGIWPKRDPEWPMCGIPDVLYVDHGRKCHCYRVLPHPLPDRPNPATEKSSITVILPMSPERSTKHIM